MSEKRKERRTDAEAKIPVRDANTKAYLGQVVNLSGEGMMLVCPDPVEPGLIFQLELVLDPPYRSHRLLPCGAESLWCNKASQRDLHWVGFRIIDISLEGADIIESLIQTWIDKRT